MKQQLKLATLAAAAFVAASFALTMPASAEEWCRGYPGSVPGASRCEFSTREQCMATASGAGGTCELNPFPTAQTSHPSEAFAYQPAPVRHKAKKPAH